MEYNKDESIRCLELAKSYLAKGEKTKAVKFATKSEQLYPSEEARAFTGKINQQGKADSRSGADNINTASSNGVRSRKKAESNGVSGAYTEEQVRAVKRIKQCKDYNEILGIERYADENEIKKKYRKLALQFHPDKNHAPGAAEAFKAISNAFSVLSDQSKRRKYDVSGPDNSSNGNRNNRDWDYSHGFESEMSPDEIFNMFFGGGNFTTETHTNGNGATAHTFRRHHHQNSEDWHQLLLQLSPVLILVILSVFSMSYTGNNPYSLSQNNEYSEKRTTENLQVVYFVMPDFGKKYHKGSVHRIEQEIEGLYISNLRNECYQERITKEKLMRLAKNSNDAKAFEKAETFDMKNCRRLRHLI